MKRTGFIITLLFMAFNLQAQDTGTITGTVTNQANDEAIAGATVILRQGGTAIDTTTTNAAGEYTFAGVPAGDNYLVRVEADGFAPDVNWIQNLQADETITSDLAMQQVDLATITGAVTNQANDEAIAGATVVLGLRTGGGGGGTDTPIDTTTTNAAGEYTFADIPGIDNYYVEVSADGFFTDRDGNLDLLDLPPNATETVNFSLQEMVTATITGTVTNQANDEVIADATVILGRMTGGPGGGYTAIDTTATNAAGDYTFADVPALDNYVVDVEAAGFLPDQTSNIDLAGMPPDATVTEDFQMQEIITAAGTMPGIRDACESADFSISPPHSNVYPGGSCMDSNLSFRFINILGSVTPSTGLACTVTVRLRSRRHITGSSQAVRTLSVTCERGTV